MASLIGCAVWIAIVLFSAFLSPSITLATAHPKVLALQAKLATFGQNKQENAEATLGTTGDYPDTLQKAQKEQQAIAKAASVVLTIIIFGFAVPPLLLLGPVSIHLQLCASDLRDRHKWHEAVGQTLASNTLVHLPVRVLHVVAHTAMWAVAGFIFIDLQFSLAPILTFAGFWIVLLATRVALYKKSLSKKDGKRLVQQIDFAVTTCDGIARRPPPQIDFCLRDVPTDKCGVVMFNEY